MGRRTILLIAAVVIAALGATMIFLYVQGVDNRAVAGQQPVQVLTAKKVITAGETVADAQASGKFALTSVPTDDVVPNALVDTTQITNDIALSTIYPGEQILAARFGAPGTQQQLTIPDGAMAVSVQLTDPARVAGFVTPGSDVAIFLASVGQGTQDSSGTGTSPNFVRMLLPKVEVIGVGSTTVLSQTTTDASGNQTTEQISKTILTLALNQHDSEKVIYASNNGTLSFGLLNDKSKVSPDLGVTAKNLFK